MFEWIDGMHTACDLFYFWRERERERDPCEIHTRMCQLKINDEPFSSHSLDWCERCRLPCRAHLMVIKFLFTLGNSAWHNISCGPLSPSPLPVFHSCPLISIPARDSYSSIKCQNWAKKYGSRLAIVKNVSNNFTSQAAKSISGTSKIITLRAILKFSKFLKQIFALITLWNQIESKYGAGARTGTCDANENCLLF